LGITKLIRESRLCYSKNKEIALLLTIESSRVEIKCFQWRRIHIYLPSAPSVSCTCIFERFVGMTQGDSRGVSTSVASRANKRTRSASNFELRSANELGRKIPDAIISLNVVETNAKALSRSKQKSKKL